MNSETTSCPTIKSKIIAQAKQLGFSFIGFANATQLNDQEIHLKKWLSNGYNAEMHYMENHFEKRIDPRLLVENAQTIISLSHRYYPTKQQNKDTFQIAKYAYGKDYHTILKNKLFQLLDYITELGYGAGRVFTDSAPLLEREWARRAGIGWIGKNSLLITPTEGSFHFLSEIVLEAEIAPDKPFDKNFCGTCTKCIDACPTQAIVSPTVIDSNKCISYWTIEHKGSFSEKTPPDFQNQIFGCDICQDVCPWNSKSEPHTETEFSPHPNLVALNSADWNTLDRTTFNELFRKSAVKRTKFEGLMRNIEHNNNYSK